MLSILVSIALFIGGETPVATSRPTDSTGLLQAGTAEYQRGHYARAEELIRKALDLAQPSDDEYGAALNYSALGNVLQAEGRLADAGQNYRKAISLLGHDRRQAHAAAIVWRNLASALTTGTRYAEALASLKEASTLVSRNKIEDAVLNAQILNNLGVIYYNQGNVGKAERFFLQASALQFTPDNPLDVDRWQITNNLGRLYQKAQKYTEAENSYKRAFQLAQARLGPSHPALTVVLDNLGFLYVRTGRFRDAESQFQKSAAILDHSGMSFDSILLMRTFYGLGETYGRENDTIRAEAMLARAADIAQRRRRAEEMPEVVEVLNAYAKVLTDMSQFDKAQRFETEAQRIRASMEYVVPLASAN
jgi:tetratricopeptide (TPR) repeat protein